MILFLGVVLYFVRDAQITSLVLDFVKLCESHTRRYLSDRLVNCLKDFGIKNRILGVVCDNTSNNDTLIAQLELDLSGQNGTRTHIHCFVHVLNLAVKAVLYAFTRGAENDDKADMNCELYNIEEDKEAEEEQDDKVEEAWECSDEAEIDEVINEADAYVGVTAAQLGVVRSALTKVS